MATGTARGKGSIRSNCPLAVISNLAQSSDLKWFHLPLKDLDICTDLFVLKGFGLHQCVPSPTTLTVGNGPSSCQALTKSKLLGPFKDSSMHMHMKTPHLGYVSQYDQPMKYTAWPETSTTSKRYVIYRVSEHKPTSPDCPRQFKDVTKTPHALQLSWFLFVRTYFPFQLNLGFKVWAHNICTLCMVVFIQFRQYPGSNCTEGGAIGSEGISIITW